MAGLGRKMPFMDGHNLEAAGRYIWIDAANVAIRSLSGNRDNLIYNVRIVDPEQQAIKINSSNSSFMER
jgi:hypothetical protein